MLRVNAERSWQAQKALIGVSALALATTFAYLEFPVLKMIILLFAAIAGCALLVVPAEKALFVYICYLPFEGAIKVLSNYNPVLHVASDLILLFALVKMLASQKTPLRTTYDESRLVPSLLALYWLWVAVQFLNPFGLGLLPSLAAMKVYVVPTLTYFVVVYLMREKHVEWIPFILLGLGMLSGIVALFDWYIGDQGLPRLHPKYRSLLGLKFVGPFYRPFGTTNIPGAPALWMVLCAPAVLMCWWRFREKHITWQPLPSLIGRYAVFSFYPIAITTLAVCQVRTLMLQFTGIIVGGLALKSARAMSVVGVVSVMAAAWFLYGAEHILPEIGRGEPSAVNVILDRMLTLRKADTYAEARQGAASAAGELAAITITGIGLSRTGSASSLWGKRIEEDPYFGKYWSFTDNAYLALFIELGIFGLTSFLVLHIGVIVLLIRRRTFYSRLAALFSSVILAAGYGSEAILYAPTAALQWLYIGLAFRLSEARKCQDEVSSG